MTLPILPVELEAPGATQASVMSIERPIGGVSDSKPLSLDRLRFIRVSWPRTAEDRATLGSDPSAAVCSERHVRPPPVEAGGLSG